MGIRALFFSNNMNNMNNFDNRFVGIRAPLTSR